MFNLIHGNLRDFSISIMKKCSLIKEMLSLKSDRQWGKGCTKELKKFVVCVRHAACTIILALNVLDFLDRVSH